MQTRGIRIVVLVVVVADLARGVYRSEKWVMGGVEGEKEKGKECNDSDSDDGGGSFREITGFTGIRLTGASSAGARVEGRKVVLADRGRREG